MFIEDRPTRFDLNFRLFGTAVRVHPLFWLIAAIFSWDVTRFPVLPGNGLGELAIAILAWFLSILLHEFGHVWMGRTFGSHGHILLHGMGGLAIGSTDIYYRWKRILVIAAGPGIQFALWAILKYGVVKQDLLPGGNDNGPYAVRFFVAQLLWMNWFWPAFNLLPVYPFDGGQILVEVFTGIDKERGKITALWTSLAVAVVLAVNAIAGQANRPFLTWLAVYWVVPGGFFGILIMLNAAVNNWQLIQANDGGARRSAGYADDRLPWER